MPFQFDTVANIISDAAVEMKLVSAAIADPFASTDPNIVQLRQLLKTVGREVLRAFEWNYLRLEKVFNLAVGVSAYDLPADYRGMVDQSGWNRTDRLPLGGPLTPQEWQVTQAMPSTLSITVLFRPMLQKFYVYPPPAAAKTLAYEYLTTLWLGQAGGTTPAKDAPTAKDDVALFDSLLMVRALKLAWKGENGYATLFAQDDADAAFAFAKDDNVAGKVLRIDGQSALAPRLLDDLNIPFTGFGNR